MGDCARLLRAATEHHDHEYYFREAMHRLSHNNQPVNRPESAHNNFLTQQYSRNEKSITQQYLIMNRTSLELSWGYTAHARGNDSSNKYKTQIMQRTVAPMEWPRDGARGIIKAWWAMAAMAAAMTTSSVPTAMVTVMVTARSRTPTPPPRVRHRQYNYAMMILWIKIIIDQWQLNYGTGRQCVDVDELRPWLTSFPLDEIIFL
jgi:hypothetical protein